VLVETSTALPLVAVSLTLEPGVARDAPSQAGLTALTARLMRRTAGGRDGDRVETELDRLGGSFGVDASHTAVTLHGATIARSLDGFFALMKDALCAPSLGEDEFFRLQREITSELVELFDDDRALARRWFGRRLYAGHAFGTPSAGTLASIRALRPRDAKDAHAALVEGGTLLCGFAGDVTRARAEAFGEATASELPFTTLPPLNLADPPSPSGRRLVIVDKPERTQTQILVGGLGTHPRDEDHFALVLANTVFGGTFTARMTQEIRSKRGWSYGAYSSLPVDRKRRGFSMWAFPKASDAGACLALELGMLENWCAHGVTSEELEWAKKYLVRSHAFAIDTASKRLGLALDEQIYDLSPGYYSNYVENVERVTLEDANRAVARRIVPQHLLIVVVGTAKDIRGDVEAAIGDLAGTEVIRFDTED
jgi:zinc protease